jgi:flagellar protein FlaG
MTLDLRIITAPQSEVGRGAPSAATPVPKNTASTAPDTRAATELAISPLPVLHAPAKVNTEEMTRNLKVAIEHINNVLKDGGRGLNFVLDDTMDSPIVKVTRADTGEVIRQYPNEAVVRFAHNIEQLKGVLFQGLI